MKDRGRYALSDDQIVDTSTGEILDRDEIRLVAQLQLKDQFNKTTRILSDLGLHSEIRLVKNRQGESHDVVNVKENHHFNKIFRTDVNYVFDNVKLSPESFAFIGRFSSCLSFPSNSVVLKGTHPTQEEMVEALGFGRTKLNNALKELEYADVIKRKKIDGKTYIFFNPFLYSVGLTSLDTYRMFESSIYNPVKRGQDGESED